jgi:hypothetical protein
MQTVWPRNHRSIIKKWLLLICHNRRLFNRKFIINNLWVEGIRYFHGSIKAVQIDNILFFSARHQIELRIDVPGDPDKWHCPSLETKWCRWNSSNLLRQQNLQAYVVILPLVWLCHSWCPSVCPEYPQRAYPSRLTVFSYIVPACQFALWPPIHSPPPYRALLHVFCHTSCVI